MRSEAKRSACPSSASWRAETAFEILAVKEIIKVPKEAQASSVSERQFVTTAEIGFDQIIEPIDAWEDGRKIIAGCR